ncbi:hypothetical protein CYMTET_13394 [Cymbomonas tetramitiformis]|uniref:Uncharacterized protein n=1 Tax=Cymbomonas tetramitiformis TaxID=36881 RepID=A0AAE0LB83_9CHLO|nr:hypothetical protein CYMTET_13394 [Cymbomonas tetramitiformis]
MVPLWPAGKDNDPDQVTPTLSNLAEAEFWPAFERRYGCNPDLQKEAIKKFVYPTLKSDFSLLEGYQPSDPSFSPLPCDLAACGAKGDSRYTPEQLQGWKQHTAGKFTELWFEGKQEEGYWGTSHRFILDNPAKFQQFLSEDLSSIVGI